MFGKRLRAMAGLSAAEISGQVAYAVAGILIARTLEPAVFGTYVTVVAALRLGALLANPGLGEVLLPRISRAPANRRGHAASALFWCAVVFPPSAGVVVAGLAAFGFERSVLVLALIGAPMMLLRSVSAVGMTLCQLDRRFARIIAVIVARTVVTCGLVVIGLVGGLGLPCLVLSVAAGEAVGALIYAPIIFSVVTPGWRPHDPGGLAREALPFGVSSWLSYGYTQSDVLIISALCGREAAGVFAVGMRLPLLLLLVPSAAYRVLIPRMFEYSMVSRARLKRLLELAWGSMIVLCLGVCVGGTLLAGPLIRFLFGSAYERAIPVLQVGLWLFLFFSLAVTVGQTMTALFLQRRKIRLQAFACALKVGLLVALIPALAEQAGAWATVAGVAGLLALYGLAVRRELGGFSLTRGVWRAAFAAPLMGLVVWTLNRIGLHVILTGLVGAAVYAVCVWSLGGLTWLRTARTRTAGKKGSDPFCAKHPPGLQAKGV